MSIDISFASILTFLLVWARLAAMLLFNPFFSRTGIPVMARNAIIIFLAFMVYPTQSYEAVAALGDIGYLLALVREIFIGLVYGYVFQIFFYFLYFAGDIMDTDFGLSMAKTFDPATNIQSSFSGGFLTALFALYIFASGSHLALIRFFVESFTMIPVGLGGLSVNILEFVLRLFAMVFSLALRLCAPFMVAEFILQASMGILMKFIPQITVFVINFQLRILLGILMLFLFAPLVGQFVDNYIDVLFNNLADVPLVLTGG